jgi:quercetin dioxygenase-like cupin family protein
LSEREIICAELGSALDDLKREGFRLDVIYPADEPHTATLSRGTEVVRLTTRPGEQPPKELPEFSPKFLITRGGAAGEGRAGMSYRDLIPGRLGGRYIASHITINEGGPVADWVHFHRIALQMIKVRRGWVRVVYEDQGEPFVMNAGDLVLQPPAIRHRVLESSPSLEVVEITAPALHETFADHDLSLPNQTVDRDRLFSGQRFMFHDASAGGVIRLAEATGGLASADVLTAATDVPPHDGELVFGFVLDGSATIEGRGWVEASDAFVIAPNEAWRLADLDPRFRLLHVTTARLD